MMKRQNSHAAELLPRGHNLKLLFTPQLHECYSTVANFVSFVGKVRGLIAVCRSATLQSTLEDCGEPVTTSGLYR